MIQYLKTKKMNHLILLALLFTLISCDKHVGEEIARLAINEISTEESLVVKEVALELKAGDEIGIWSDMNIAFEGQVDLRFRIGVTKNGDDYTAIELDPLEKYITLEETKNTLNGKTNWQFIGKNKGLKIDEDATYLFKVIFVASKNPSLEVIKAEVILKR